jgi:hypothetical protein
MSSRGTRRRIPKYRQTVMDLLAAARGVPAFPLFRTLELSSVDAQRRTSSIRIGWTALFLKAYAIVCRDVPELRERFVRYPIGYLYRHPTSVASVTVHRTVGEIERLIWSRFSQPDQLPLEQIQEQLSAATTQPLENVYREGMMLERNPWLLRRLSWWFVTRWSGRKHAKHIGTFSISSLGGNGCLNAFHPLVTTTSLAMGPLSPDGRMEVVLICDHRVLDGMLASRALAMLETTLCGPITEELAVFKRASSLPRAA